MAHLYHANAKTTVKIREKIKLSTETIKALSEKYFSEFQNSYEMEAR